MASLETDDLTWKTPQEVQDALMMRGYQWVEHVFNDGHVYNCLIYISRDTTPTIFNIGSADYDASKILGWGRFPRQTCWMYVWEYIRKEG